MVADHVGLIEKGHEANCAGMSVDAIPPREFEQHSPVVQKRAVGSGRASRVAGAPHQILVVAGAVVLLTRHLEKAETQPPPPLIPFHRTPGASAPFTAP